MIPLVLKLPLVWFRIGQCKNGVDKGLDEGLLGDVGYVDLVGQADSFSDNDGPSLFCEEIFDTFSVLVLSPRTREQRRNGNLRLPKHVNKLLSLYTVHNTPKYPQ